MRILRARNTNYFLNFNQRTFTIILASHVELSHNGKAVGELKILSLTSYLNKHEPYEQRISSMAVLNTKVFQPAKIKST